jgi:hypothetical protein
MERIEAIHRATVSRPFAVAAIAMALLLGGAALWGQTGKFLACFMTTVFTP